MSIVASCAIVILISIVFAVLSGIFTNKLANAFDVDKYKKGVIVFICMFAFSLSFFGFGSLPPFELF